MQHCTLQKRILTLMRFAVVALMVFYAALAKAQGTPPDVRYQPPRPPPLDPSEDFEELEDDSMEMGDEGYSPPPPPSNLPPPVSPQQNVNPTFTQVGTGKVKFQIVDNEFYEKGKKRGRGKKTRGEN